jgi:hypothetical protein
MKPGKPYSSGSLGTVDLLFKVACFAEKLIMFTISKAADLN